MANCESMEQPVVQLCFWTAFPRMITLKYLFALVKTKVKIFVILA